MWDCFHCGGRTDDDFQICWSCRRPRDGSPAEQQDALARVKLVTTPSLETHRIGDYLGLVSGEAIMGANLVRDMLAAISDVVGGRASAYEEVLLRGRHVAVREMAEEADRMGADAVVGISLAYESVGDSMLLVCVSGTAVRLVDQTGELE